MQCVLRSLGVVFLMCSVGVAYAQPPTAPTEVSPDEEQADPPTVSTDDASDKKQALPRPTQTDVSLDDEKELVKALAADAKKSAEKNTTAKATTRGRSAGTQSMNPDISIILDVAGAYFSDDDITQLGAHDPKDNGITFQQLEMAIESTVDPYFKFNANLVFSLQGIEIEEAYATTLALAGGLQMRAGQFLLPFGRANVKHPHSWAFVDQLLSIGKFLGSESMRGLGLEVSWLMPLPWYSKLTAAVHQPPGECCGVSYAGDVTEPPTGFEDLLYTTRLENFFELSSDWSVLVGGSAIVGENKRGLGNLTVLSGADLLIKYRPSNSPLRRGVRLQAEWIHRQQQVADDLLIDHGGYVELIADLNPEWSTGYRWQLVTGLDNDLFHPDWTDTRQRHSAQVTWYPSHFSRIRLQSNFDQLDVFSVMLAFEVVTGAHGAHGY